TDVAGRPDRRRVEGNRRLDPRRERLRQCCNIFPGEDADDAGQRESRCCVDSHVRVSKLRANDSSVTRVRNGLEIVHEPSLTAEQSVVLEARDRPADPWSDCHGRTLRSAAAATWLSLGPP